jgi:2-oxoglutarate dehydrogenase E2 component (dihydrolipoamide succinyltransferase)
MTEGVEIRAPSEQTEGTRSQVLRWLKRPGETVRENEPLIEIETDKVTVEVAAPASGVLLEILKQEQEEIEPGALLGRLAPLAATAATAASVPASDLASARERPVSVSRDGEVPASGRRSVEGAVSPAVRRLLAEHRLEAAAVAGSGPGGRITVEDVLRAAAATSAPAQASSMHASSGPTGESLAAARPAPAPGQPASDQPALAQHSVPHSAVRKRTAAHMVQSLLHTAPHVTTVFEADLGAVLLSRARLREEFAQQGVPLTLSAYFVQAAVAALRAVPEVNSRWTESALEIYETIHIGVATAVEGTGLVVPVLRDAGSRDLFQTARGLDDLVVRARSGKLTPADVRGGTFTISNHGVSGSLLAAPIVINQPQSAILGIGKLEKRAVVVEEGDEEKVAVRPRCYVTLTLDHRALDGHQANRFMQVFVQALNEWPA